MEDTGSPDCIPFDGEMRKYQSEAILDLSDAIRELKENKP